MPDGIKRDIAHRRGCEDQPLVVILRSKRDGATLPGVEHHPLERVSEIREIPLQKQLGDGMPKP